MSVGVQLAEESYLGHTYQCQNGRRYKMRFGRGLPCPWVIAVFALMS